MTNIVFFTDRNMLPGLHVALISLMRYYEGMHPTEIIIFCDKLDTEEKGFIKATWYQLNTDQLRLTLSLRDMPPIQLPAGANSLHGNITTYGRLFLGEWLAPDVDKVIYLDCDLIIQMNVQLITEAIQENYTLVVDGYSQRKYAWDHQVLQAAGLPLEGIYFNAGVLGINLKRWRQLNLLKQCMEVMRLYPGMLLSCDQSVLNIVCANDFYSFGKNMNYPLYYYTDFDNYAAHIYHFVGTPKPFDVFGKYLHRHYRLWHSYFEQSAIRRHSMMHYTTIKRLFNTRRSYIRALLKRVS